MLTALEKQFDKFESFFQNFAKFDEIFSHVQKIWPEDYHTSVIARSNDMRDIFTANLETVPPDWSIDVQENDDPQTGLTQRTESYCSPDGLRRFTKTYVYSRDVVALKNAKEQLDNVAAELADSIVEDVKSVENSENSSNKNEGLMGTGHDLWPDDEGGCECDLCVWPDEDEIDEILSEIDKEENSACLAETGYTKEELENFAYRPYSKIYKDPADYVHERLTAAKNEYQSKVSEIETRLKIGDLLKAHELLTSLLGKE